MRISRETTPDNYKPDNDSAKTEGTGFCQKKKFKNVVTKEPKPAEPMKGMKEEETVETEDQQEIVAETEETTDEVVAEGRDCRRNSNSRHRR